MKKIKIGRYQHFKGGEYQVIGIARHSETLEELVVYYHLDKPEELWVRPKKMFLEKVENQGRIIPRFRYLGNKNSKE